MRSRWSRPLLTPVLVAALALLGRPARATTLVQLDLQEMCQRADKIFRGTVLSARAGTVEAGGGRIPTVTYRIEVEEALKGEFPTVKGRTIAEIRMVGKVDPVKSGSSQRFSVLSDVPRLAVGETYLLLTTAPSSVGLSTTVGLGQGRFRVLGKGGSEQAVNDFENRGLLGKPTLERPAREATARATAGPAPTGGPLPYSTLAGLIRGIVGTR